MKLRTFCLWLLILQFFYLENSSVALSRLDKQEQATEDFSKNWVEDNSFGFPIQIALDVAKTKLSRKIYLFIKAEDFSEKNIKTVFAQYAEKYRQTKLLYINAYSNKEYLNKLIDAESSCCLFFDTTPEGKKGLDEHLKTLYPPASGYYRARLHRTLNEELIFYSPYPEKEEQIKLKID